MPSRNQKKPGEERLMTPAELAAYLHLGQKTVLRLASTNKLPGLLVDNQWRFKRSAVDAWLEDQFEDPTVLADVPDGMHVPLSDLLSDEGVIHDLGARDALGVIEELAARAYSNRWLADKPWFVGALVERESLASTAMEGGVAFLHTRAHDKGKITRPFVVDGRSYHGIDIGAPDGRPTPGLPAGLGTTGCPPIPGRLAGSCATGDARCGRANGTRCAPTRCGAPPPCRPCAARRFASLAQVDRSACG
jgi:excisionase family DNA binding protein